jgi:hypothetical protein
MKSFPFSTYLSCFVQPQSCVRGKNLVGKTGVRRQETEFRIQNPTAGSQPSLQLLYKERTWLLTPDSVLALFYQRFTHQEGIAALADGRIFIHLNREEENSFLTAACLFHAS